MCEGVVRETPVIDTQGESGQWLASLISCPESVYGLEQTQHTWWARDNQTASNDHREGWTLIFSRRETNHELFAYQAEHTCVFWFVSSHNQFKYTSRINIRL